MSSDRLTLALAGHVDHGKTALARALTGVDTDRLPEEKRRGLTIQPGFADLQLPSGRPASLVDLPGHERFVRHMIGGATGVDGALLCVAAHDGAMPQTHEHLDVLDLLGIPVVAVAVTFADRRDPGALLDGLDRAPGSPVVPVVSPDGVGVENLRRVLDDGLMPRRVSRTGEARLPIDRAFSVRGAGTVVTGTLCGSAGLAEGDAVRVEPSGVAGRVRRLEVHDGSVPRAVRGRVALNLAGVAVDDVPRGAVVLAAASAVRSTDRLVVRLSHCASSPRPLRGRERLQAFVGTAEATARIRLVGAASIGPGVQGEVELRLDRPVVALPGDRVLLRSPDPTTVAGGPVVAAGEQAVGPPVATARSRPAAIAPSGLMASTERALEDAGLHGVDPARMGDAEADLATRLTALAALRDRGRAVHASGRWFHEGAVRRAEAMAIESWTCEERNLGDLRRAWGVSRASAEALAGLLDRRGVTLRRGPSRRLRRGALAP